MSFCVFLVCNFVGYEWLLFFSARSHKRETIRVKWVHILSRSVDILAKRAAPPTAPKGMPGTGCIEPACSGTLGVVGGDEGYASERPRAGEQLHYRIALSSMSRGRYCERQHTGRSQNSSRSSDLLRSLQRVCPSQLWRHRTQLELREVPTAVFGALDREAVPCERVRGALPLDSDLSIPLHNLFRSPNKGSNFSFSMASRPSAFVHAECRDLFFFFSFAFVNAFK